MLEMYSPIQGILAFLYGREALLLTLPDGGLLFVWACTDSSAHLDEGEPIGAYCAISYDERLTWRERVYNLGSKLDWGVT